MQDRESKVRGVKPINIGVVAFVLGIAFLVLAGVFGHSNPTLAMAAAVLCAIS